MAVEVPEALAERLLVTRRRDRNGRCRAVALGSLALAAVVGFAAAVLAWGARSAL